MPHQDWVKSYGERLRKCGTQQFRRETTGGLSAGLREALEPLLREVESLNERIQEYDRRIEKMAKQTYPETALLKQLKGVGDLIATTYVLTIEDPHRFRKSRDAGCFVGLQPGRRDSGESAPQMRISKEGDEYLRTLLVQGAHYILGPFGEDSDLRRWGRKLSAQSFPASCLSPHLPRCDRHSMATLSVPTRFGPPKPEGPVVVS
jgi:transposase